jgi:heptosyltransferase-3
MTSRITLPARPKLLVVTLRRLGDVLLTTPLVRSLRRGFPDATLDVLVFAGSDRILKGNSDVDHVLTMPQRPSVAQSLALIGRLWRRYDLVLSTQAGDRPTFYATIAGRRRIGLVPLPDRDGAWWKRHMHHAAVAAEPESHRVEELARFAQALGVPQWPDLVCPDGGTAAPVAPYRRYAVLHPNPMYRYKRWSDAAWRSLVHGLVERGLAVVATEGRDADERAYADALWEPVDPMLIRERGRLDWAGLTALLRGAAVYVGPDTSMTHLAAGSGCPTIAIYGPTRPRLIGPWPVGGLAEPWNDVGTVQRRGNVWLVQNPLPCMPCDRLGCERHLDSPSVCLEQLSAQAVLAAVDRALEVSASARPRAPAGWREPAKAGMQDAMAPPGMRP